MSADGAGLRDLIAEAALDAAAYTSDGECWVDPARIPADDDPDDWTYEPVNWDFAAEEWRQSGYRIADAVLAALRAAGAVDWAEILQRQQGELAQLKEIIERWELDAAKAAEIWEREQVKGYDPASVRHELAERIHRWLTWRDEDRALAAAGDATALRAASALAEGPGALTGAEREALEWVLASCGELERQEHPLGTTGDRHVATLRALVARAGGNGR